MHVTTNFVSVAEFIQFLWFILFANTLYSC